VISHIKLEIEIFSSLSIARLLSQCPLCAGSWS